MDRYDHLDNLTAAVERCRTISEAQRIVTTYCNEAILNCDLFVVLPGPLVEFNDKYFGGRK